jgi:hypothetical protein
MTDEPIVSADQTVVVEIHGTGRKYTLRAPTFGEVGVMAARQAGAPAPSDAIFVAALREALKAAPISDEDREEHLAAIARAEDAGDTLDSVYAAHGVDRKQWDADARREIKEAEHEYRAAQKGRARAEWAVRDSEALAKLRRHQSDVGRREQTDVVRLCVTGPGAPKDDEAVAAMPALDVATIYQRAIAMMRPTQAAEKN